jgi:FeS assembly SUF system protein
MFWRKRMEQPTETVARTMREPDAPEPAKRTAQAMETQADPAPAEPSAAMDGMHSPEIGLAQLEGRIIEAISEVYDPEIPVNIYELGLIYDLHITADHCVRVEMTLTSPACPVAGSLPGEVEAKIRDVEGVNDVALELVWDPPWTPDRMTEAAKLELGFM